MNWKLSRELARRGFQGATSVRTLNIGGKKDGALIKWLSTHAEPCTLITWDNKMPLNHRSELDHFGLTLAVVDDRVRRDGLNEEEFYRDVVHRWAHRMQLQAPGERRRYSRTSSAVLD